MLVKRLPKLWENLRGKKNHMPHFLEEIRLDGIRGIKDLTVPFDYPVCVIAGGNATGKSTVLFAAACAYKVTTAGPRDFVPSSLFPAHRSKTGGREDELSAVSLEYEYSTPDGRMSMRWRLGKSWNRSFFGRKGGRQPERLVYLRTLSNLANPSEVRSILRMSHTKTSLQEMPLNAAQIDFAQQIIMLPFRYKEVIKLADTAHRDKDLLFAVQDNGTSYSELHMSAGERAVLRLSQAIAQMQDALILIDEVEAGLHPMIQQLLMLHLQQLALRNDLQIIVTSHSPAVLDSVPAEARIFLERNNEGKVRRSPAYKDIIQNALYGRSNEVLNLLCEDEAAENILRGIFEKIFPLAEINPQSVRIGRNAGAPEFPGHAAAFQKFNLLGNFVFVLDGDQHNTGIEEKITNQAGGREQDIVYLPGNCSPEEWIWERLDQKAEQWAQSLRADPGNLIAEIKKLDATYAMASDPRAAVTKSKLSSLATSLNMDSADICRKIARLETEDSDSEIQPLVSRLTDILQRWRSET